jgi:hypothetical protein
VATDLCVKPRLDPSEGGAPIGYSSVRNLSSRATPELHSGGVKVICQHQPNTCGQTAIDDHRGERASLPFRDSSVVKAVIGEVLNVADNPMVPVANALSPQGVVVPAG